MESLPSFIFTRKRMSKTKEQKKLLKMKRKKSVIMMMSLMTDINIYHWNF